MSDILNRLTEATSELKECGPEAEEAVNKLGNLLDDLKTESKKVANLPGSAEVEIAISKLGEGIALLAKECGISPEETL